MQNNSSPKHRWFYILLVLLSLIAVFSIVQTVRDLLQTSHIRQVNESLQSLRPDTDEPPSPAPQASEAESSPDGLPRETEADSQGAEAAASSEVPETVIESPTTIVFSSAAPTASPPPGGSSSGAAAEASPTRRVPPVYHAVGASVRQDMQDLLSLNADCVGWIRIPNVVDLPVLYREADNFYETHDFYTQESIGGSLFLDPMHPLRADTQNLVIHGHNMKDGTMFGHLVHFLQESYFRQHQTITLTTLYEKEFYDIFCVAEVSVDPSAPSYVDYLSQIRFSGLPALLDWADALRGQALHWKNVDLSMDDAFLTLSTCLGENRLLVVGRKINYN